MDLDTLLRETAAVPDPSPHALASGRTVLAAATAASGRRLCAIGRARSRRTRRLGLTAIVASAASLVLVIAPTVDLNGGRPVATADAAQVLLRAGTAAGAQPGGWPDAAYWRSVSTYHQGSGATHRREIWIGHHAIGVLKDDGVDSDVIPLDVALFPAGSRALSWDALYALPTDSLALERELRAGIGDRPGKVTDKDGELFVIVGDLLRESPAAPALREALWEVAARIPGVTLVGVVADSAGRSGVAVERGDQRYVLDPKDGRLLEESEGRGSTTVSANAGSAPDGASAPSVTGQGGWISTYLEQGPVDTAPTATNVAPKDKKG
ncbi:MAG: hypothetical protein JWM02_3052 [Frankiales bacterium]|nr:hypothetical protein [Frankiales bacterium]